MTIIKNYHKKINQSYDPEEAYKNWKRYRDETSDFMASEDFTDQSILLLASGHLNDLDLNLFQTCKDITFVDLDIEASKAGYQYQGLKLNADFKAIDLSTMTTTTFMEEFMTAEAMSQSKLLETYKDYYQAYDLKKFDYIIVLPVYTQLLLPQLLDHLRDKKLLDQLMTFMGYRIQIFNHQIIDHLNKDAKVIVLSDILEYKTSSEEAKYLQAHQKHMMILEEHINTYHHHYGHGLGSYGLAHLTSEMKNIKETILYWPFSKDKIMLVKGHILKNKAE